jgi:hypothetical protein
MCFLGRMAGEALGHTASDSDAPQVPFGCEHNRIAVNRRETVVAGAAWRGIAGLRAQGEGNRERCNAPQVEESFHGLVMAATMEDTLRCAFCIGCFAVNPSLYHPPGMSTREIGLQSI